MTLITTETITNNSLKITYRVPQKGWGYSIAELFQAYIIQYGKIWKISTAQFFIENELIIDQEQLINLPFNENYLDILINLKKIYQINNDKEEYNISFIKDHPQIFTSHFINENNSAEENEIVIAHYNGKKDCLMKLFFTQSDSEYSPQIFNNGTFFLNPNHSSIKAINYYINNFRVGMDNNYDEIVMELNTLDNNPIEELRKIVCDIEEDFIEFEKSLDLKQYVNTKGLTLDMIELSVETMNSLKEASIFTLDDLLKKTEEDLLLSPYLNKKSLLEIENQLVLYNLKLLQND
jgi:DNA-directed RNA polymerase alpha subunit